MTAVASPQPTTRPPVAAVTRADRTRRQVRVLTVLMVVALTSALFGLAVFHAAITDDQVELDRLERAIEQRQGELHQIQLEVAALESPARLQREAASLGLVRPDDVVYVVPDEATVVRLVAGAAGS